MPHELLYHQLRAVLLERRFVTALGQRTYMYSGGAVIRHDDHDFLVQPPTDSSAWSQMSASAQDGARQALRARFAALPTATREDARWMDETTNEENPWLHFAPMAIALAVEQRLGHAHARAVLDALLQSLAAMFVFGGNFAGYPIRWDAAYTPIGKRHWFDRDTKSRATEFLLTDDGNYDFANRPADFRQHPRRTRARLQELMLNSDSASLDAELQRFYDFKRHCRQWEVSQDEVFGIVTVLWAIATIATDAGLRSRALLLLRRVAGYLGQHAYLLVRPQGGLTARGHGDSLVGCEFALNEAFAATLGNTFPAVSDPEGAWAHAMRAAGYWDQVSGLMGVGALSGAGLGWAMNLLATVPMTASLLIDAPLPATLAARLHPAFGVHVGKMLAVMLRSEVFDPWSEEFRIEPALSMFLHEHPARFRYELYCDLIFHSSVELPVTGFMPFHSLFGLDRQDRLLTHRYLLWFDARRARATKFTPLFSLAVACLLAGDGRYEEELRDRLDDARIAHRTAHGDDLPLAVLAHDGTGGLETLTEDPAPAIDYMGALALAWLHAQRRGHANTFPGFPAPPNSFGTWRRPSSRPQGPQRARVDLFPGDAAAPRLVPPRPDVEPAPDVSLPPQEAPPPFLVPPNVKEVDTGIDIRYGDIFTIEGSGSIAVFGTSPGIPPTGIAWPLPADPEWPVHTGIDPQARRFALTARLNGWFVVGSGTGPRRWWTTHGPTPANAARRLFLRVNQPAPQLVGWGGGFQARVRVWRHDPGPSPIAFDNLRAYDFFVFPPRLDIGYRWAQPSAGIAPPLPVALLWIHVRQDGGPWALLHGASLPGGFLGGPMSGVRLAPGASPRHVVAWLGDTSAGFVGYRNGRFEFRVTLVVGNIPLTEIVACDIQWHGERIQCVRRPPRGGPTGLLGVGGVVRHGRRWQLTLAQAIEELDRGQTFYVEEPVGDRVAVVVDRVSRRRPFLRTVADGDRPNNLLSLPSCP